jgi:deoxyribodipyrimidine photo-lyase
MVREQRASDNWPLLYAQQRALEKKQPLYVVFACRKDLRPYYGTARMLDWMLGGLKQLDQELRKKNISFNFVCGDPVESILCFAQNIHASEIIVDFFPLKIYQQWHTELAQKAQCLVTQVDGHNIVPCWIASPKQEFAARTIRPKLHRLLPKFLYPIPKLQHHPVAGEKFTHNWPEIRNSIAVDETVLAVTWAKPGERDGLAMLDKFIEERLLHYSEAKNDPTTESLSELSPYLHFGQLSAQRVALEVKNRCSSKQETEVFLEELIIRRELSDNFCFYNTEYDTFKGFPSWAQKTLSKHFADKREFIYTQQEFENAQTHDTAWNAAQNQMILTGKMHGYMRMYWAKKVLEWSKTPQQAQKTAIYLNDRYSIDGRDPNGYVGIAWSIGGVHDRPWFERQVFGSIRFMSDGGLARKFDLKKYIATWT